jgi:hypothetical protein
MSAMCVFLLQDTDFKWSDLQARNNNELLKNLGNFVNRWGPHTRPRPGWGDAGMACSTMSHADADMASFAGHSLNMLCCQKLASVQHWVNWSLELGWVVPVYRDLGLRTLTVNSAVWWCLSRQRCGVAVSPAVLCVGEQLALPVCCVRRALVFVSKFFGGVVPAPSAKGADKVAELGAAVSEKLQEYVAAMEKVRREGDVQHQGPTGARGGGASGACAVQ